MHGQNDKKEIDMKKTTAIITLALGACLLCGCGSSNSQDTTAKDKVTTTSEAKVEKKDSKKDDKKTEEKKEEKKEEKTEEKTEAKTEEKTEEKTEATTEGAKMEVSVDESGQYSIPEESIWGDIWGQSAIVNALEYAGDDYICVSLEKGYLRNNEHWIVGLKKMNSDDGTVYTYYVNDSEVVPAEADAPSRAQGSGQNIIMNFIGEYYCDRAVMTVSNFGSDGAAFVITAGGGYSSNVCWTMSGDINQYDDRLEIPYYNGAKTVNEYNDDGSLASSEVEYNGGSGCMTIWLNDNSITWSSDDDSDSGTYSTFTTSY